MRTIKIRHCFGEQMTRCFHSKLSMSTARHTRCWRGGTESNAHKAVTTALGQNPAHDGPAQAVESVSGSLCLERYFDCFVRCH